MQRYLTGLAFALLTNACLAAEPLKVATASNFEYALKQLLSIGEGSKFNVEVIPGATGRLYAQTVQGAPYHVFLSADTETPLALAELNRADPLTYQVYTEGQLALIGADSREQALKILSDPDTTIGIAQPRIAPYGAAAQYFINSQGISTIHTSDRWVTGENVRQVLHFIRSGNLKYGLVSLSLAKESNLPYWQIPQEALPDLHQSGIVVNAHPDAKDFLKFLSSPASQKQLIKLGYLAIDR